MIPEAIESYKTFSSIETTVVRDSKAAMLYALSAYQKLLPNELTRFVQNQLEWTNRLRHTPLHVYLLEDVWKLLDAQMLSFGLFELQETS